MATVDPAASGVARSRSTPSISAITAAFASRDPIDAARSAAVAPSGSSRSEPSGRLTVIVAYIGAMVSIPSFRTGSDSVVDARHRDRQGTALERCGEIL